MSFEVLATHPFERKVKKLAKKYKSLAPDLAPIIEELYENPTKGTFPRNHCYKIRVAIASKGKGKAGGARLITYVRVIRERVYLLGIYDKSEQETINEQELALLITLLAENLSDEPDGED